GTNRLRGSAAWDKMPAGWFAGNFFANKNNAPDGDFGYNRWSASLSGPVVIPKLYNGRNRTFFMWAYEGLTDQRPRGGAPLTVQYYPIGGSMDVVHTFSPTVLLNVRYGYTRFTRQTDPLHGRGFDLTSIGFPKALNDAIPERWRELPAFNINGYFNSLNTGE